jgi:spoIIIJ-associated protein
VIATIEQLVTNFFQKLQIDFSEVLVKEETENIFSVWIQSSDSWILIWQKGKNLDDITALLKLIISRNLGKSIIIHLEINDYLQAKEQKLIEMINGKIEYVKKNGGDYKLPYLSSYERKKVHAYVSWLNNPKIYTKSMGEWEERRLYICKKDEKITIDADSNDI